MNSVSNCIYLYSCQVLEAFNLLIKFLKHRRCNGNSYSHPYIQWITSYSKSDICKVRREISISNATILTLYHGCNQFSSSGSRFSFSSNRIEPPTGSDDLQCIHLTPNLTSSETLEALELYPLLPYSETSSLYL